MTYQPSIPTGSVPLNQDYLNLQGNFSQINDQWQVDHVPLTTTSGTPPNGYHTAIHLVPESTPAATPGYSQIYAQENNDGFATAQQLFYQFFTSVPTAINVPLTRNFLPVDDFRGYTFLPGGLVLQWGYVSGTFGVPTHSATSFNIPFPNACFTVIATPFFSGTPDPKYPNGNGTIAIYSQGSNPTTTSFVWNTYSSATAGTNYTGFYWLAIGN